MSIAFTYETLGIVELTEPQMVATVKRVVIHNPTRAGVALLSTNRDIQATNTTAIQGT